MHFCIARNCSRHDQVTEMVRPCAHVEKSARRKHGRQSERGERRAREAMRRGNGLATCSSHARRASVRQSETMASSSFRLSAKRDILSRVGACRRGTMANPQLVALDSLPLLARARTSLARRHRAVRPGTFCRRASEIALTRARLQLSATFPRRGTSSVVRAAGCSPGSAPEA